MKFYVLPFLFAPFVANANLNVTPLTQNKQFFEIVQEYKIHNKNCPWENRLVVLKNIPYHTFEGKTKTDGTIITLDVLVHHILKIFQELHQAKFPIGGINPFDGVYIEKFTEGNKFITHNEYNFAGSYACRNKTSISSTSLHSYGTAIDINPFQNPYAQFNKNNDITTLIPQNGGLHLNRSQNFAGKINEKVIKIFAKNGFPIWGGNWHNPKDYHHFETFPNISKALIVMNKKDAQTFFQQNINFYNKNQTFLIESKSFKTFLQEREIEEVYQSSPKELMAFLS